MEYTVEEAAKYLRVDEKDIYGYISSGELAAWNKARNPESSCPRFRISQDDLDTFKASRKVQPKSAATRPLRKFRRIPQVF